MLVLQVTALLATPPQISDSLDFVELQQVKASVPSELASFGNSVAIDGNTVVIGEEAYNSYGGRAYVFEYDAQTHTYTQVAILSSSSTKADDYFGRSVAVSGDTVVIGAVYNDDNGSNSGTVYIYEKPPTGWEDTTQENARLNPSTVGHAFGESVAISGDTIVIGAESEGEVQGETGVAYIYEKPAGGWRDSDRETAMLKASDAGSGDYFGRSVAISGDTVIIGAFKEDNINTDSGAAYIYEKPINGWVDSNQERAKLKASDADKYDKFGYSVAISGDTVVIGARFDDEINEDSGAAYIYEKPIDGWADSTQEDAKLKASDADKYDYFGKSVAISGDTVVVGANGDDEIESSSGAVYVYKKPQIGWRDSAFEDAKLKASDIKAVTGAGTLGKCVAISGDTLVAGASDNGGSLEGAAYIFTNSLVQNIVENRKDIVAIQASNASSFSLEGGADNAFFSINADSGLLSFKTARDFENPQDADGNNIYEVGIRLSDASGATHFYNAYIKVSDVEYEGESLQAKHLKILNKLKSSDSMPNKNLGYSVAVDGTTAVIGEHGNDSISGRAYVYEYNTTAQSYDLVATLDDPDDSVDGQFGISVAIYGDTVVIGADLEDELNTDSGAVYVYTKRIDYWYGIVYELFDKLKASDADVEDHFGKSVAIDGDTIVVGAFGDDEKNINSGAVYIFEKVYGSCQERAKLKALDSDVNDYFGISVAISGDTIVVGANGDEQINSNSGAAYIFEKPIGGWVFSLLQDAKLKASDAGTNDFFGYSVAISGDSVVIGAYGNSEVNSSSGAAYIYEKPQSGWRNSLQEEAKLKASDAGVDDKFGVSVAISADTIIVGAFGDDEISNDSGAAYIYEKPQNGWVDTAQENKKLKASDADVEDYYGIDVAISGDTIAVGAFHDDETTFNSGAAYMYKAKKSVANSAVLMYLLN